MLDSFPGKLRLHDGTIVDSVLTIADDTLTVSAEGMEVGTWPMKYCRVSRVSDSEFEVSIDGERTVFHPVDGYSFGKVAADRFHGSSIADRINVIRSMPVDRDLDPPDIEHVEPPRPTDAISMPRIPWAVTGAVVAAAALIAIGGWAVSEQFTESNTPASVSTTTTIVAPTTPELFLATPDGFRERWNEIAIDAEAKLVIGGRFGAGRFQEALSDEVLLTGAVDGDGTITTIKLSIHPTTSPEETEFALASMGLAIRVADSTLAGSELKAILRDLGLADLRTELRLDDVGGEVVENGIRYWLIFIDRDGTEDDLLSFGISEAG